MKAVIIDGSPEIVDIVSLCFKRRWPEVQVFTAHNGSKGLGLVQEKEPDVVVLDQGLPDMDGKELCRRIRAISDVPILAFAVLGSETGAGEGLDLGADDYVEKPFSHIDLLARAGGLLGRGWGKKRGGPELDFVTERLLVDPRHRQVFVDGKAVALTPNEFKLLHQLVKKTGTVVTYESLLVWVWGDADAGTLPVLKVHMHHLRRKLEEALGHRGVIVTERGMGYRFAYLQEKGGSKAKSTGRRTRDA